MKNKKKNSISLLSVAFCILAVGLIVYKIYPSYSAPLNNDVRVEEDSPLTYYLEIDYDGKDSDPVTSSPTATARVYSDYIDITDQIPEGLIFNGFVDTDDGTIGAVEQGNEKRTCPGYVIGGVNGLKYDENTRTVSFRIADLKAGCKVSVGIKTTTPFLNGKRRMDFYNFALGKENDYSVTSNTVHTFMGNENEELYPVRYEYKGNVPENAPALPNEIKYANGTIVGVQNDVSIDGYTFSGWETSDVTINNGTFTMPSKEVVLRGEFVKKDTYKVTYKIEGAVKPSGYTPPKEKVYSEGQSVKVDSMKTGDIINKQYRFLGWKSNDVQLPDETTNQNARADEDSPDSRIFTMPNKDVEIVGQFERIEYKVTYQFQGSTIPENAENLLPAEEHHYPGENVKLAPYPEAEGYKFLGWYKESEFTMPTEDIVVYGEWQIYAGLFSPEITKKVVDKKDFYSNGEHVPFEITVTNKENNAIKDIRIQEQTEGSYFIESEQNLYEIENDLKTIVKIPRIEANSSVIVKAEYIAGDDTSKIIDNVVEITTVISEGGAELDTSKEYKAHDDFRVANLSLTINKVDEENHFLDGAEFTLYKDSNLTEVISTGLEFTNLGANKTYYLKETKAPTGYKLLDKVLPVFIDEDGMVSIDDYNVSNNEGVAEVTIANERINILPNTGGVGIIPFVLSGLIIVIVGSVGVVLSKKRRIQ